MYPEDLRYTKDHEWIKVKDGEGTVGITQYAQDALGDIVFVELPEAGEHFGAGDVFGSIESVKAVSDLYIPVSGEIKEVNSSLDDAPEVINNDPYGEGWICKISIETDGELDELMDVGAYREFLKEMED